jgi:hypothetical protein
VPAVQYHVCHQLSILAKLCRDVRFVHALATCRFLSFPMADLISFKSVVDTFPGEAEALKLVDWAVPRNVDPAISCGLEHLRSQCSSSKVEKGAMSHRNCG